MMIKFFNIYGIALIIVLGWLVLRLINRKKSVSDKDFSFIKNKKFELAAVAALILLASGIVVSRNAEKSSIDAFENKPVFADLEKDINNVSSIVLQDKDNKVELDISKDGIWKNLEHQEILFSTLLIILQQLIFPNLFLVVGYIFPVQFTNIDLLEVY